MLLMALAGDATPGARLRQERLGWLLQPRPIALVLQRRRLPRRNALPPLLLQLIIAHVGRVAHLQSEPEAADIAFLQSLHHLFDVSVDAVDSPEERIWQHYGDAGAMLIDLSLVPLSEGPILEDACNHEGSILAGDEIVWLANCKTPLQRLHLEEVFDEVRFARHSRNTFQYGTEESLVVEGLNETRRHGFLSLAVGHAPNLRLRVFIVGIAAASLAEAVLETPAPIAIIPLPALRPFATADAVSLALLKLAAVDPIPVPTIGTHDPLSLRLTQTPLAHIALATRPGHASIALRLAILVLAMVDAAVREISPPFA
mmetsp:Transcript_134071/g.299703  ORF Transcript_134071/g.299703 Transcript_134071/m.299703 type:complete len:315 (-) Transcript_134071:954-1898(-)